ncbi:MAG TPA: T9SS type A sorting domain-containing protein, partial [Bacteroidales bacterium]
RGYFYGNPLLTSLTGIENIDAQTIDSLSIIGNSSLSTCDVQSICDYLASPNGSINIYGNASGCNNPAEVASNCGTTMPCLPYGNYYFLTQSEIDNFQANFPGCNDLKGNVQIKGNDITSLEGLSQLTSVEGNLNIYDNPYLTNLSGLNTLSTIGSSLNIFQNSMLTNLEGLNSLNSIGLKLYIDKNNSLTSLSGLDNLQSILGSLYIGTWNNDTSNPILADISALANIDGDSIGYLFISGNYSLSECAIKSICEYLAINYYADIWMNGEGCNNQEEVEQACLVSVENIFEEKTILLFPNPANKTVTIAYKNGLTISEVTIYNQTGQKVYRGIPENNTLDISKLQPGMYVVEVATKEGNLRKKLIIQ